MAYTPTNWTDRSVSRPRTYTVTNNSDGTITLTPSEGTIYNAGTPITAGEMNNIESGIVAANNTNPNLLLNSTGEHGYQGWSDNSSGKIYTFLGGYGEGNYFIYSTSGTTSSAMYLVSNKIYVFSNVNLTLSGEIFTGGSSGTGHVLLDIEFHDSNGNFISNTFIHATHGQDWTKYSLTCVTPANTSYVVVLPYIEANVTNTGSVGWRRIKLEAGTVATPYSQETDIANALTQVSSCSDVQIASTSQTSVINFTPITQENYEMKTYLRIVTAATYINIQVWYPDASGPQTAVLFNGVVQPGSYMLPTYFFNAVAGKGSITLAITAGTANQVYVSASLVGV